METLRKIQLEINGKKDNFNQFASFSYRNAEELFNEIKPLLAKYNCNMTVDNELVDCGGKQFIKSIVTFVDGEFTKSASAFAAIDFERKGMDNCQACGSAQSYATKYALCSLLLLSDSKLDSDSMPRKGEEHSQQPSQATPKKNVDFNMLRNANSIEELTKLYHEQVEHLQEGKAKSIALEILGERKKALQTSAPVSFDTNLQYND